MILGETTKTLERGTNPSILSTLFLFIFPSMPGLKPASVLDRQSDASCPQDNGTVWSADGYSWDILCNYDFPGNDLPTKPASSLTQCIDACNNYEQDEKYQDGASCVAVVYGAANPNGRICILSNRTNHLQSQEIHVTLKPKSIR